MDSDKYLIIMFSRKLFYGNTSYFFYLLIFRHAQNHDPFNLVFQSLQLSIIIAKTLNKLCKHTYNYF
jgi:hypothetical protein